MTKKWHILSILIPLFTLVFTWCESTREKDKTEIVKETSPYLNHSASIKYVGMNTCKGCHQKIYNSFIETGMGKSFDIATRKKSSGDFTNAYVYDKADDFNYHASWKNDSLFFTEYRIKNKDTVHLRTEQVNYIIGSGQHTNSHIQNVNGYLNQMPMTYYTQKKTLGPSTGF